MRKQVLLRSLLLISSFVFQMAVLQAQPANDECINATPLDNVSGWCSTNGQFTTIGATPSVQTNPNCFPNNTASNDVWFSFVAQANTVNISVAGTTTINAGGTISNPQFALYSGTCGNLTLLQCASDAMNDHIIQTFAGDLIIGQTYYIRVSARFAFRGTFRLCVNNYNEVPSPSGDCGTAVVLCDKSSFTVPKVVGTGSQNNEIGNVGCNGPSCVITESSSTWYKWTCRDAGTLTFTLSPLNPADDLDFVVYELPGGLDNCNSKNPIRCMASGENVSQPIATWLPCTGATGLRTGETDTNETCGCPSGNNNFIAPINMVAGRSYALVVNNFSNSGDGFTVTFGGTGTFLGPTADFSISPQTVCVGQPVTLTDQSTFTGTITDRTWSFGLNSTPTTATGTGPHTVSFDRPGIKSVLLTVRTDRGCLVSKVLTVNVECCPDHFTSNQVITDVLCAGASTGAIDVSIASNYPPYTYTWGGGQTSQDISGLPAGSYALTVTDRATCSRELNYIVTQPTPVETDTIITMPTCNGGVDGAATLQPRGGVGPYQFNWQGTGFSSSNTLANIPRGDYPVVIRDANNCLLPLVIPVRELELILNPTVQAITQPTCTGFSDGSIVVDIANGRGPFQYNWGAGFVPDNSLLNVAAGVYNVEVRDANLCLGIFQFDMQDHPPLALGFDPTNTLCFQDANGSAVVTPSGGVGNYTYAWQTGSLTNTATGLSAGTYTVTVLDGNNCRIEGAVTITEPPLLQLIVTDSTGLLCSYDTTGRIGVMAVGGTPDYEYSVDGNTFQMAPVFNSLRGGTYTFTVMDAHGCTATVRGTVNAPPPIVVDAGPNQIIELGYTADISATVSQNNLTISWTPPISLDCPTCLSNTVAPLQNTTYVLTALDPNNCIAIDSVTILVVKNRPIYIPNAISPNDDGINDGFTLYAGPAARQINRLRIFDRWGELIFDKSNIPLGVENQGWDGTIRGRPANAGVYVFMAEVGFIDDVNVLYEGDVTIVK
ncbi:MAG TPA: gliding motility-associated C-terminal domain-containing protein [Saprospiraceae bacterium]|nr:gliding motility-associated C-terminal domain-containing protein [Saprospiraceae bacterium]